MLIRRAKVKPQARKPRFHTEKREKKRRATDKQE